MPYGYIEIDDGHAILVFRDSDIPEGPAGPAGGVNMFDDLTDCPASKVGQALKQVRVNAGETALEYSAPGAPAAHHATHENGGADEISVAALSGTLADDQPPAAHAIDGAKHTGTLTDGQIPAAIMRDAEHAADAHTFLWRRHQYQLFIPGTLTAGAKKLNAHLPALEAFAIEEVYLYVDTAPTGAAIIVDCNKNGVTIFTNQANRPQVAIGANSGTSGTPDVTAMAKNDRFTVDIDQIGSTIAGADLMVSIRGKLNLTTS